MDFHEVASIFPMMSADEYAALVEDMRRNGQRESIWTYQGKIIDGRNRYRACQELGIEPRVREWDGNGSLVAFVVSLNLHRRHLNSSQRTVIGLEVERALAVEARERQVQAAIDTNIQLGRLTDLTERGRRLIAANTTFVCPTCSDLFDREVWHCPVCNHHWQMSETECRNCHQHKRPKTLVQNFAQASSRSSEQAAALVGSNRRYIIDAKKVAAQAPDVLDAVRSGVVSIPDAKRIAVLPEPARAAIIDTAQELKAQGKHEGRKAREVMDDAIREAKKSIPEPPRVVSLLPAPEGVRLEVGNALDTALPGGTAHLILTSPPYGLDIEYDTYVDPAEAWYDFMQQWLAEAYRVAAPGGWLVVNVPLDTSKPHPRPTYAQLIRAAGLCEWEYRWSIVWHEGNVTRLPVRFMGTPDKRHVFAPVEMIAAFRKGDRESRPDVEADLTWEELNQWAYGVWDFPGESRAWEGHPAAFPEELPRRLVKLLTYPGDVVLDPFCGSGTTVLAAWLLGRRAIGLDISENYIESAKRRILDHVGAIHHEKTA